MVSGVLGTTRVGRPWDYHDPYVPPAQYLFLTVSAFLQSLLYFDFSYLPTRRTWGSADWGGGGAGGRGGRGS